MRIKSMSVSRRSILRAAAAAAPAAVVAAAGSPAGAAPNARWELFPVSPGAGSWFTFNRISVAPDGAAKATGTYSYFPDGPLGPAEVEARVWSFGGTAWTSARLAPDTRPMTGITVTTADDAWAVGEKWDQSRMADVPQMLHWDGTAWTQRMQGAEAFARPSQVSGTGDDVWAVGTAATSYAVPAVVRRDGPVWAPVALPPSLGTATLRAVRVVAADDVWVAGSTASTTSGRSLVLHWDGSSWTELPAPFGTTAGRVSALLATDGGRCWAAGSAGNRAAVAAWDGHRWTVANPVTSSASEVTQLALHGSTEVWAAGAGMPAQRWNGSAWSNVTGPLTGALTVGALANGPDGALWMAGSQGTSSAESYFFATVRSAA
jgi:hypothetical protein